MTFQEGSADPALFRAASGAAFCLNAHAGHAPGDAVARGLLGICTARWNGS